MTDNGTEGNLSSKQEITVHSRAGGGGNVSENNIKMPTLLARLEKHQHLHNESLFGWWHWVISLSLVFNRHALFLYRKKDLRGKEHGGSTPYVTDELHGLYPAPNPPGRHCPCAQ